MIRRVKASLTRLSRTLPPQARKRPAYWLWRRRLARYSPSSPASPRDADTLASLRAVVSHAYAHTDGYRELFDAARVKPRDLVTFADLAAFPFVSKELIRDNLEAFSVRRPDRLYITTGGSTGIPFGFYVSRSELVIEEAFIHDWWQRCGWRMGRPTAVMRGVFVGSEEAPTSFSAADRQLSLSSYFISPRRALDYLAEMARRGVVDLQAYPSSLAMFLDALNGQSFTVPRTLERILLGSENVYDWLEARATRAFPGVRLVAWYGHAERAVFAWRGEKGLYDVHPLYGATELLTAADVPCADGEEGEIVATSYHARVTPFIRYRTMDRAVQFGSGPERWRRIMGRNHEVLVTRGGRLISMTAINMHDDLFDPLLQFQFVQSVVGEVEFHVVPRQPLSDEGIARIRRGLLTKLGGDVSLTVRQVDAIPRTPSGKLRFLDQRLAVARHEQVT